MGSEGFTMQCTESALIETLIELYSYNVKRTIQLIDNLEQTEWADADSIYEAGKANGAVDALSVILFQVLGGKEFYQVWEKTMHWANKEIE